MYTPLLQVEPEDIYLTAGQENTIQLELENRGDFDVFEVQGTISSPNPGITVVSGNHRIWNEIEAEDSVKWKPELYVNPDVPLGTYGLTLTLGYIKMFTTGATLPEQTTIQIGVIVNERSPPKLQYIPPEEDIYLKAGSYHNIEFDLKNIWEKEIRDLQIDISSSNPSINLIEGIVSNPGNLEAGESLTLSPQIYVSENAPPSQYQLTATAYYGDKSRNRYYQVFIISMTLESIGPPRMTTVAIKKIETHPGTIKPGDQFSLDLEVEVSGAVAYDLSASLVFNPQNPLSPLSPTIIQLGDISRDSRATASYNILVDGDIPAGQYPLTAILSYTNSKGGPVTLTETLTILVEGIVDFDLINNEVIELVQGETTEIEMDLLLLGTQSVRFVDLELITDQVFERVGESNEYIGAVDPDSPIPFQITTHVKEDGELGDTEIKLRVVYTDHLNKNHEETVKLPVRIVEPQEVTRSSGGLRGLWLWLRRLFGLTP
jgi:hypothetical protein